MAKRDCYEVLGSWLDMAEIELNVMTRQCLSRRIDTIARLKSELSAWETECNRDKTKIRWHFQTGDAREKLISLYPIISWGCRVIAIFAPDM